MIILIDILLVILTISASAFCIYAIIFLKRLNSSIDEMKADVSKLVEETLPVISNLNKITEDTTRVTTTAEKQVSDLNQRIEEFKTKINTYRDKFSKAGSDNQIISLVNNLRAISKGISAFAKEINKQ